MGVALCFALLLPAQTIWVAKGQPAVPVPVIADTAAARPPETVLTIPIEGPRGAPDDGLRSSGWESVPKGLRAIPQPPRPLPADRVQAALADQASTMSTETLVPVSAVHLLPVPTTPHRSTPASPSPLPTPHLPPQQQGGLSPARHPGTGLNLRVQLPPRVLQGQPVACEIVLQAGEQALAGVRVDAALPSGCQVLSGEPALATVPGMLRWELGPMPAHSTRTLRAQLLPTQGTELLLQPQAHYSLAQAARTQIVLPPIGLRLEAPPAVPLGEVVRLRLQVQNNTPHPLRRLRLSCALPEGLLHAQGQHLIAELSNELPAGQSRTEELALRAQACGPQTLQVQIQADGGLQTQQHLTVEVQAPQLTLQVQSPRSVRSGEEFTVRLLVANPGRQKTPPLRVFLALPDGVQFVAAGEKGQMHPAGACLYWTLEPLAAETYQAVTASLRGVRNGEWAMTGIVQGPGLSEVRCTQAVRIEEAPKLTLELSRLEETLPLDGESLYTLRIYNPGPLLAQNVQAVLDLPAELLPVQAEGPVRWRITGQRVIFEPIQRLPSRRDVILQVRVRAERSGVGVVRGAITAYGLPEVLQREVAARVK
jgi:hypothetical protein